MKDHLGPIRFKVDLYEYVYFSNPKVCSTTILCAMKEAGHISGSQIHGKHAEKAYAFLPQDECSSYFKFGFVRNPWGRVASLFLDKKTLKRRQDEYGNFLRKIPRKNFDAFLKYIENIDLVSADWHLRPQLINLNNLKGLNFVGRFENFTKDCSFIGERIGICPSLFKWKNKSKQGSYDYRDLYSQKQKEIVAKLYKEDIEVFDYEF